MEKVKQAVEETLLEIKDSKAVIDSKVIHFKYNGSNLTIADMIDELVNAEYDDMIEFFICDLDKDERLKLLVLVESLLNTKQDEELKSLLRKLSEKVEIIIIGCGIKCAIALAQGKNLLFEKFDIDTLSKELLYVTFAYESIKEAKSGIQGMVLDNKLDN